MSEGFEVSFTYELPVDSDGFLRRECPTCSQEFKWHSGPANEEAELHPEATIYYCPLCGDSALKDQWFTPAQATFIQGHADAAAMQRLDEELSGLFRGMSSKHVKIKQTGRLDVPDLPDPLVEVDDMVIVLSPCHSYEPVKVPDDHTGPLYCLVCGEAYAV